MFAKFVLKFVPTLLTGISVGGQYALIAIGYTMVYGILRLINFAHGDVFMVAGLVMVYASAAFPLYISIPIVLVATVILGFVIERVAYKPLRSAPRMSVMISAIGVSYLLQNCALYITGGLPQNYPAIPALAKSVHILGATTKMVTIVTPILTLVLVVVLSLVIRYTKIGMAMRAVSKDFASLLYFTNYQSVIPTSGSMPGLKAFVAAVFGGIGSIPGAVIGAFIIGICENIIKALGWTTFSDAFTFVLLILVLLIKPTGIFGEKATDKV